jgi:hypothetical protein
LGRSHKGYDFDDTTGAIIGACIDVHDSCDQAFGKSPISEPWRWSYKPEG